MMTPDTSGDRLADGAALAEVMSLLPSAGGARDVADLLEETAARLHVLTDAMPQMVWSTLPDGYHDYYNARWYEFTGVPPGSTDGEGWNGMFHPDDQPRAWERWRHSLETGEPYEIEYRLRHRSGAYRWTLGRALPVRDRGGAIVRWIGTCTDIHDQKRNAEQAEILSRELSHRIKNIFAVVVGLIALSPRTGPGADVFAEELQGRITALGKAHEFVRPHSPESAPLIGPMTLHALIADILSAYPARQDGRLTIAGDDSAVDDRSATPIALVFHELATNAMKYGALSVPEGVVEITITSKEGQLTFEWRERGGPRIETPPTRTGFGSELVEVSVVGQLEGKIDYRWNGEGLSAVIVIPARALLRA